MTVRPIRYDLTSYEGDIFRQEIRFTDAATQELIDLTGLNPVLIIKEHYGSNAIMTLRIDEGLSLADSGKMLVIDVDAINLFISSHIRNNKLPPVLAGVYAIRVHLSETRRETWVRGLFNYEVAI